jgi:phage shock protein C
MAKLLKRSKKSCIVAGVCGGLGEFFGMDPVIWRLIFILGALFSIVIPFILIYIIMWIVVPEEKNTEKTQQ